ncbi:MAG: translation elongation factor Ts [Actinobacteria bacterium]|nr:translation elongation factor Ts [Actinomycetota bacterium]OPZ77469.1 MAG: Elongation factor Ts [Actinobacteria bacterium ADurb.Bin444]
MTIDAKMVKDLRDMCGAGMMDCKRALEEAGGNVEEAVKILRTKGMATADKKASRAANEGLVHAYIHPGARVGVLVEVNCETDFVARNEFFVAFVHDVAMQIAASSPRWVKREDIPQDELDKELEIYKAQARETGKPENVLAKIAEGKLAKWYEQVVLLEQPFVKEPEKTVETLRRELVGRIGENIEIARFARFRVGERSD